MSCMKITRGQIRTETDHSKAVNSPLCPAVLLITSFPHPYLGVWGTYVTLKKLVSAQYVTIICLTFIKFIQQTFSEHHGARAVKGRIRHSPCPELLTFLTTQCGKYWGKVGGEEVYIPTVRGAQKHRQFILSECVRKGFTEVVIVDKLWLSRSSNGMLVCTGTSGKVKMFREAELA